MAELNILRHAFLVMRCKLASRRDDEGGVTTLEAVLWIAGLAVLAIGTLVIVTSKVNTATTNIPTGP